MEQFVVSAIKYRPLSFASVVGQASIGTTLKNAILRGHLSHAYLFCGPRGVGKTTCARIFAKTINCLIPSEDMEACGQCESCRSFAEGRSYSIHELDAASNNSVDDIRTLIEKVRIPPQIGKYSVYIIDEVHMLSSAAFNAFLKTLEEPPAHALFILATTEKHKILPTILSRCQIYDFSRITIEDTVKHLENIATKEGVTYESEAFNIIARKADGAMRDALSIFDRVVSFCGNNITYKTVIEDLNVLDYEYFFQLTDAFIEHRYIDAYLILDEILRKGFDPLHFINGLSGHFRDLLVSKDPRTIVLLGVGKSIAERYQQQSERSSLEFLFEALNLSNHCEVGYKSSANPRFHVELAMLNLSNIGLVKKKEDREVEDEEEEETENGASSQPEQEQGRQQTADEQGRETPVPKVEIPSAPQSISLKSMLSGKKEEVTNKEESQATSIANEFTQERLQEVWLEYTQQIQAKQPRMSSVLAEYKPTLKDHFIVSYPAINDRQKDLLAERSQDLVKTLREKLMNSQINVEWVVIDTTEAQSTDSKKRLYTSQDKLQFLIQKNPTLEDLRKELDMDFR